MDESKRLFYSYSEYLKQKYGQKVYKLPVNLPVSCPNRMGGQRGCAFCSPCGAGFEAQDSVLSVSEQLQRNRNHIEERYHAHKFIAYFQNYTNTFLPIGQFRSYLEEAAAVPDLVGIAVSTRPDCLGREYLEVLNRIRETHGLDIIVELGLQTANYHTLEAIGRGHTAAEFIDAALAVHEFDFELCAHVILNLPGDELLDAVESAKLLSALRVHSVKVHSLYIARNTRLCEAFENGTITVCSKEEYQNRVIAFLEHLNPEIAVERLYSRAPQEDTVFCNWGVSWWKLKDELTRQMQEEGRFQGRCFHYLNGAALRLLQGA